MSFNLNIKNITLVLILITTAVFTLGILIGSQDILLLSIVSIYIVSISYGFSDMSKNITLIMFMFTSIIFLFGRIISQELFDYWEYGFGIYQTNINDSNLLTRFYVLVYLSIQNILVGFIFTNHKDSNRSFSIQNNENKNYKKVLMWVSKIVFIILIAFRILVLLDRISFVNDNSYFSSFEAYSSSYPLIMVRLSQAYSVPFFMLLALRLEKKQLYLPLILFLFEGIVSLFTGRRMNFILNIIILVIYFIYDDSQNKYTNNKWINKWTSMVGVLSIPVLVILSNVIFAFRSGIAFTANSLSQIFGEFFYKQGVTLTTILNSFIYKKVVVEQELFTLGPISNFLRNNIISNLFIKSDYYTGQTIDSGLYSPLFGHRISYFIDSNAYLNGRGYGSSYLAESYVDFGVVGVVVVSLLIGVLLSYLYKKLYSDKIIVRLFGFILIMNLMVIPRSETTSFITNSITINNLLMYFIISIVAKVIYLAILNRKTNKILN